MAGFDKARWIELYTTLEKPLYNVVYRVVWDAAESQDIVQETFLRCWQKRGNVRDDGVRALLFRTALNLAINRRRRARLWQFVGVTAADEEKPWEAGVDGVISRSVRNAVDALPDRLRRVLLLTELAGMSYAEVAMTLGIREGTVGSRRTRALAILRRQLEDTETSACES